MRVQELTATIEFDKWEISDLAYSLYYNLKSSIKDHYNSLQQEVDGEPVFYKQEQKKVNLMKDLFGTIGQTDLAENFIEEFTGMFEEKRKERENKNTP